MSGVRCANCRYWLRKTDITSVGSCNSPKFVKIIASDGQAPRDGVALWAVNDIDSYKVDFETGEDFFCVHFSPVNQPINQQ